VEKEVGGASDAAIYGFTKKRGEKVKANFFASSLKGGSIVAEMRQKRASVGGSGRLKVARKQS